MAESSPSWSCPGGLPAPKLFLFGPDGGGVLKLTLADGSTISVRLRGRHVRVLLALNNAHRMDQDIDELARGYMTDENIAEAYSCGDPLVLPPSPQTIRAYRSQINERIHQETPPGWEPPKLFAVEQRVGVRLTEELSVIDLGRRHRHVRGFRPDTS